MGLIRCDLRDRNGVSPSGRQAHDGAAGGRVVDDGVARSPRSATQAERSWGQIADAAAGHVEYDQPPVQEEAERTAIGRPEREACAGGVLKRFHGTGSKIANPESR